MKIDIIINSKISKKKENTIIDYYMSQFNGK